MRFFPLVSFVSLSLPLLSGAEPIFAHYQTHEKRAHLPRGWTLTKRLDATFSIPLRIALKQNNIDNIDAYLYDVSHPRSSNYGKHWSPADIARTFAPSDESIDTVRKWLTANGIHEERISLPHNKGWMHVNVTVEEAEQLMMTEYNMYTHTSGKKHVACEVYHLPEYVQAHVDFVTPSVHFDAKLTRRSRGEGVPSRRGIGRAHMKTSPKAGDTVSEIVDGLEHCDKQITPNCLRALYEFYYEPVSSDKNSYGIVEYTPNAFLQSDLDLFARNISRDLIGKSPHLISIDGGVVQTVNKSFQYDGESDLDSQYAMSLVTGKQEVTLYQVGDLIEGASFNNFLDALDGSYCTFEGGDDPSQDGIYPDPSPGGYKGPQACGTAKPANVISTSYSYNEADLTPFYARRQCAEYAKLGLMGVTFLYSSGDFGVAGNNGNCLNSNGTQTADGKFFNPTFPGTCPYITSIGATMIKPNATVFDPEVACMEGIYSSGGFSNYFPIPDYQKDAVEYYLTYHRPHYPTDIWNSTGSRAFPDISANGANYVVAVDGEFGLVYGTSASAPVCGAMIAMINDARLAVGKNTIGFINPTIYSPEFADAFHDIIEGSNPGCGTLGFNATQGWDPVTGLGTPNFSKLLALWLALP